MKRILKTFTIAGTIRALAVALLVAVGLATPAFAGTLYVGTDTEEFAGLPGNLGRFTTSGATITGGGLIPIDYPLNGMVNAGGFLYAGDPGVFAGVPVPSKLRTISYDGALISEIPAAFPTGCCNA